MIKIEELAIIDTAIRDHVIAFNNMGYETFTSCAGHFWDINSYPYISFKKYDDELYTAARFCGLDVRDFRDDNPFDGEGCEMGIYAKEPSDTEGFVYCLENLLMYLNVRKQTISQQEEIQ